jgi:hypothetical protein
MSRSLNLRLRLAPWTDRRRRVVALACRSGCAAGRRSPRSDAGMPRCTPAFLGAFPRLLVHGRLPASPRPWTHDAPGVCTAGSVDGPVPACRSACVPFRMCGRVPGRLPASPCVWAHGSTAVCTAGLMPACRDGRWPARKSETEIARMETPSGRGVRVGGRWRGLRGNRRGAGRRYIGRGLARGSRAADADLTEVTSMGGGLWCEDTGYPESGFDELVVAAGQAGPPVRPGSPISAMSPRAHPAQQIRGRGFTWRRGRPVRRSTGPGLTFSVRRTGPQRWGRRCGASHDPGHRAGGTAGSGCR